MTHEFFIPCSPPKATSQQKSISTIGSKPVLYKNKNVRQAEKSMTALLHLYRPEAPFSGAISLQVLWVYPWRKSEPKKNRVGGILLSDKRPDCSNLIKSLEDCMTRLNYWQDDSQIAELHVLKAWGDYPGIGIKINSMSSIHLPVRFDHLLELSKGGQ